jgi:transcription elongation factor GreA
VIATPAPDHMLITAEGYEQLRSELETLRTAGRREMTERLREARADGRLEDNPVLFEALEEQAQLEHRIALLEGRLASAQIAEPNGDGTAGIGSSVRLRDLETDEFVEYELVGTIEGNARQGQVSVAAPVGRSIFGAVAGDVISVDCPRGELRFEVTSVDGAASRAKAA